MNNSAIQRTAGLTLSLASIATTALPAMADAYDAPDGYYDSATGTGATLKSQLTTIMSTGHIQRTYGDFRFSAAITDQDPNDADNILLVYDRDSVDGAWNTSPLIWNREHVWPQSRQPGSASNGTSGNLGDPHALRPSDVQVNSDRGNLPFGFAATTGSYGSSGSAWYPGDADAGDIARSLFYSATRYSSSGLTLVNGTSPGTNEMGDLESLIAWHYIDTPDDFERRRNHTIYSQAENPFYYTNNRNAYVDRPEFVHSVFVDNFNDTKLTVAGGTVNADGSSSLDLDLGKVIVGSAMPTSQSVTLNKAGVDGTYYSVTASGDATSSVNGRYNAFTVGSTDSTTLDIGLSGSTATAGVISGSVTIDNLDVTTGLGSGFGDNDGDDVINASLTVVEHAEASFSASSNLDLLTLDFGTIEQGATDVTLDFDLFNFDSGGALVADLDLDNIVGSGDTGVITTDLAVFSSLAGGNSNSFTATLDTTNEGLFSVSFGLFTSDEDIAGAADGDLLALTITAEVVAAMTTITGDYNADGFVSQADLDLVLLNWGDTSAPAGFDENAIPGGGPFDNLISQNELDGVLLNWGDGTPPNLSAIPEPSTIVLASLGLIGLSRRRR